MLVPRTSLDIPVFAGQGSMSLTRAQTRERHARLPSGDVLLSACHMAFHAELASLSSSDMKKTHIDLSDFASKDSLLIAPERPQYLHNPVISGSAVFIVQCLRYLACMDTFDLPSGSLRPFTDVWQCSSNHGIGLLGFSSGIITACIASTSPTRISFLSHAVEAYRLVLWIGIRSQFYRRQTLLRASLDPNTDLPWSLVFSGIDRHNAKEALDIFNQDHGSGCLYITAVVEDTCITISGRPDHLTRFATMLLDNLGHELSVHPTTVDTLYHSPVHVDNLQAQVLSDIASRNISFPNFSDVIIPIRSTFTGDIISGATSDRSLVELVLDMVLTQPVNWNILVQKLPAIVLKHVSVRLVNMGPGNGLTRSLERAIVQNNPDLFNCTTVNVAAPQPARVRQEPIAIIGMAVNMPGAPNTSQLWELLEKGLNTISEIPEHRFKVSDYTNGKYPGRRMKAHTGNFLQGVDEFDHKFFKISPREAKNMDPQQRILLHVAYEALEDSGYVPYSSPCFDPRSLGCYVGCAAHDYFHNLRDNIDVYYSTGTLKAFLSGRLSYTMQLSGPSVVVDTACSSSSVALYQAARALMNQDCNAAMVGGINVISGPDMFLGLDKGHFLSPTGQCRSFDASADGYARSEGCGVFVLKRLSDALAENDKILAVIRGVEVNQSGLAQSITQPHAPTQSALLEQILSNSGVDRNRVNVVEAHGTGTQAGDFNELQSIRGALSQHRSGNNPLYITSIKANIGHLEAASGSAGLAKLILMLQHKIIPGQISLRDLNSRSAPLSSDYTLIPKENVPWIPTQEDTPRAAILNNFGASGSNVAVLIEEYISPTKASSTRKHSFVFGFSAKSDIALQQLRARLVSWLQLPNNHGTPLLDFAYTSTARRQQYDYRLCVSATDRRDLIQQLESVPPVRLSRQTIKVIFVFSGQGSQYLAMGSSLYETSPTFRQHINECHSILTDSGFPGILPFIVHSDRAASRSEESEALQSSIFSLEFALSKLWLSWGIQPAAVVGHSLGEYVGLVIAQVLSLKDALIIVATRARLMAQKCSLNSTGMIAVSLGQEAIRNILESTTDFANLLISCYNSPTSCVVSGPSVQITALKSLLDAQRLGKNAILSVPFGYHSPAMMPLIDNLTEAVQSVKISPPAIPIVSNVFGTVVQPGDSVSFNSTYFAQHCLQPVKFCSGIETFLSDPAFTETDLCWLEIGPHPVVLPMLRAQPSLPESAVLLGSLRKDEDAWTTLSKTLSRMYTLNLDIKWRSVFAEMGPVSCVSLPSYPFSKDKFWVPFVEEGTGIVREPVNEHKTQYTFTHSWIQYPSVDNGWVAILESPITSLEKYIRGHSVANAPLCPASVYFEILYAAISLAKNYLGSKSVDTHIVLREVQFSGPLVLDLSVQQIVQVVLTLKDDNGIFSVNSRTSSSPEAVTHASGEFRSQSATHTSNKFARSLPFIERRLSVIPQTQNGQAPELFSTRTAYELIFPRVVEYSREYHTMQSLVVDASGMEASATIKLPVIQDGENFVVHPIFLDTILHMAGFVANLQGGINDAYICNEVGSAKIIPSRIDPSSSYTIYCNTAILPEQKDILAECFVLTTTATREVVAHVKDIRFRKVRLNTLKARLRRMAQKGAAPIEAFPTKHAPLVASPKTSSSSNTEQMVSQIIADACGVSVDNILSDTDLKSLGVDSLMWIEIWYKIRQTFPSLMIVEPSHATCGTVSGIAQKISTALGTRDKADGPLGNSLESSPRTLVPEGLSSDPKFLSTDGQPDIRTILSNVLDIKPEDIDDTSTLDSLGLDSLASIEALHILNKAYGLHLPNNFFLDHPTVRSIQNYIFAQNSQLHAPLSKVESSDNTLIHIQTSSAPRPPLFLIHDGSGLVNYCDRISPLGRDVWGLRNPRFSSAQSWDSLGAMASAYVQSILKVSMGPLILGGWSFGGVAAFEIAKQLAAMHIKVLGVVLIDSPSPISGVPLSAAIVDTIVTSNARGKVTEAVKLTKQQFLMNSQLLAKYDPKGTHGPNPRLIFLRCVEGYNPVGLDVPPWFSDRSNINGTTGDWEKIVGQPVQVVDIPGHHFEAFSPSNIQQVSKCISEACTILESP